MSSDATSKVEQSDQNAIIEEKITKIGSDPVIKKYLKGKLLGKGGFAKCYEITSLDSKKVMAAKIIQKATLTKSRAKQKLISEIKIHKSLRHCNVVGFEHVFEDSENVYILLELCPNQSMHDLIKRRKRLTELEVQCYTLQLISALKYLHNKKVIHRDLKLGNLFLNDKMELKVGDFGLAAKLEFENEKRRTVCGTPNYIAPEIIEGKGGHSYEVDTWSLGVIIYTLLVGKPPFETADVKLTYKKIKACSYAFPDHVPVSENAKNLVTKMLCLDPSKRPSLDDILDHAFLRHGYNIPKFLPVSTLTSPPSNSYLTQYSSQENIMTVHIQSQKSIETSPLSIPQSGRYFNTQKNNLVGTGTEKLTVTNPQSPVGQNNENVQTHDKVASRGEARFTFTKSGTWQLSGIGGVQSLKDLGRPFTGQQKDLRTTERVKTSHGMMNLGSTLRVSGPLTGFSRGKSTSNKETWVKKWVDYSSKYGMGYLLSNGSSGVLFNDNTKMLLDSKGQKLSYFEKNKNEKQESSSSYQITDYPKELQKKVTLLQHFKNYLGGNEKLNNESNTERDSLSENDIYIKKWVKTKNATMFRLSNKIVQVNFTDKTELIMNSENKVVTYVNKKGERSNFPLTTALENSSSEMAKRLKYAKELLATMVNTNTQPTQIPTLHFQ